MSRPFFGSTGLQRPRNTTALVREEIETLCVYCESKPARPGSEYCCEAHAYYDREGRP